MAQSPGEKSMLGTADLVKDYGYGAYSSQKWTYYIDTLSNCSLNKYPWLQISDALSLQRSISCVVDVMWLTHKLRTRQAQQNSADGALGHRWAISVKPLPLHLRVKSRGWRKLRETVSSGQHRTSSDSGPHRSCGDLYNTKPFVIPTDGVHKPGSGWGPMDSWCCCTWKNLL